MDLANERFATLNRQELYERVWNTPPSKLAKEFGISDVELGKVCKRHNIPRPPRGYWARSRSQSLVAGVSDTSYI